MSDSRPKRTDMELDVIVRDGALVDELKSRIWRAILGRNPSVEDICRLLGPDGVPLLDLMATIAVLKVPLTTSISPATLRAISTPRQIPTRHGMFNPETGRIEGQPGARVLGSVGPVLAVLAEREGTWCTSDELRRLARFTGHEQNFRQVLYRLRKLLSEEVLTVDNSIRPPRYLLKLPATT